MKYSKLWPGYFQHFHVGFSAPCKCVIFLYCSIVNACSPMPLRLESIGCTAISACPRPCRDEQSHLCRRLPALVHLNRQHRHCRSGPLYELTVQREPTQCPLEGLPVLLWDQTLVSIGVSLHLTGSVYCWLKRFIIPNTKWQEKKSVSSVGSEDCSLALGFRKPSKQTHTLPEMWGERKGEN